MRKAAGPAQVAKNEALAAGPGNAWTYCSDHSRASPQLPRPHEGPDAAPEAGPKRRGRDGAESPRCVRQPEGLRSLIAEAPSTECLGSAHEFSKSRQVVPHVVANGRNDLLALGDKLLESKQQVVRREIAVPGMADDLAHSAGRVGARFEHRGKVGIAAPRGRSPQLWSAAARRETRLYFSMAWPVFSATTPLTPTANTESAGNSTVRSNRTGQ